MSQRFRTKTVEVTARQITAEEMIPLKSNPDVFIPVSPGDWLVSYGDQIEVVSAEDFKLRYEPIGQPSEPI